MKVAIQGGAASFHDIATRRYFKDKEIDGLVECVTFRDVFLTLLAGKADYGVIAIENAIAGSILGNYTLMQEFGYPIVGEIHLRIVMCLMALKGQKVQDLHTVKSHYMALLQCNDYLSQYPNIKIEEYHDTADSAKHVKTEKLIGVGAIAGRYAAHLYDLDVIAESIETVKQNFTRFLIISRNKNLNIDQPTKASLAFTLQDSPGTLSKVLRQFDEYHVNLTKIQSIPLLGYPGQYTFYIDCTFEDYTNYKASILHISSMVTSLNILGEYKQGEVYHDRASS